jgi:hypothetical protein
VAAVRSSTPSGVWWDLARRGPFGRVDHDEVGDRPRQRAPEHPVAHREAAHPVADLVDDARVVGPEAGGEAQAEPGGGLRVGGDDPVHRVQAGRGDPDPQLARARLRRGNRAEVQDVGAAERVEPNRPALFLHVGLSPRNGERRETDYAPFAGVNRSTTGA